MGSRSGQCGHLRQQGGHRAGAAGVAALLCAGAASAEIRIAHVYGKTGPFEAYAKQSHDGLMLGLEYATDGSMEIDGEPIVVIEKDTQLKPDLGKALLAALAKRCVDEGLGRFEWWVLDWNEPAIQFYQSQGAVMQNEWTVCRVSGAELTALAGKP